MCVCIYDVYTYFHILILWMRRNALTTSHARCCTCTTSQVYMYIRRIYIFSYPHFMHEKSYTYETTRTMFHVYNISRVYVYTMYMHIFMSTFTILYLYNISHMTFLLLIYGFTTWLFFVYMHMPACARAHACARACVHACARSRICSCAHSEASIERAWCVCVCVCVCVCACVCTERYR